MIRSIVRACVISVALTLIAACADVHRRDPNQFVLEEPDYGLIANAALKLVERTRNIDVIVVDPSVSPAVRKALKSQRKVVSRDTLGGAKNQSLPPDYFVLRRFDIDDGEAMFEGEISTDAHNELTDELDCGLIFSVRFALNGDDWHSDSYKLTDCSQERVWYPNDAAISGAKP